MASSTKFPVRILIESLRKRSLPSLIFSSIFAILSLCILSGEKNHGVYGFQHIYRRFPHQRIHNSVAFHPSSRLYKVSSSALAAMRKDNSKDNDDDDDDDDYDDDDDDEKFKISRPGSGTPSFDFKRIDISPQVSEQLGAQLTTLVSIGALKTTASYMNEFRDEVTEKWMLQFCNYSTNGFADNKAWSSYIQTMIQSNKTQIQVTMRPPKSILRGKHSQLGSNVMIQYFHDIEPRKIAHQLLTVREDISEEMIQDVGSILLEHEEAIRWAKIHMEKGKDAANKSRRPTRMSAQGGSTPLRDRNYYECAVLITNAALDLVRENLRSKKDVHALQFLESYIQSLMDADTQRSPEDRMLHEMLGPRELIEGLYLQGLTRGLSNSITGGNGEESKQNQVNVLSIAQNVISTRASIAAVVVDFLKLDVTRHRQYYRMINDYGGFQKLDLSPRPKFTILDLDAESAAEAAAAAALKAEEEAKVNAVAMAAAATLTATSFVDADSSTSVSLSSSSTSLENMETQPHSSSPPPPPDINLFDVDESQSGPFLM